MVLSLLLQYDFPGLTVLQLATHPDGNLLVLSGFRSTLGHIGIVAKATQCS
jgi:hypothetical protein